MNQNAVEKEKANQEYFLDGVKVRITYPERVNPLMKQQKINRIYDLLADENDGVIDDDVTPISPNRPSVY